ncbi:MAG: plasmid mobilization relaxosome protein MobC [Clostridia bacterium]|nr:plasmid mobilization relaxosome protein MobC [Clostridia bacterium]
MRARNNRIMLRLSDKEYESLIKSSEKVGVPREVYLRMLIMGTAPKEKPTADFYSMMKELNAIGNSLNQIAKVANSKGFINVKAYEENVRRLNEFIVEISKSVFTPERRDDKWLLQEYGL